MVHSSREIQWRLRRHFPDNAFFDRVFHVRSLEGERLQPVCLAEIGDGALKKIAAAMGGEAWRPRRSGRTGGTAEQVRRHWMGLVGKKGRQTEYMEKQRKVFLDYLKIHHETASKTRMTLARDCWAIHRKEWNAAAKKGIGYSDYKALSRAKLM